MAADPQGAYLALASVVLQGLLDLPTELLQKIQGRPLEEAFKLLSSRGPFIMADPRTILLAGVYIDILFSHRFLTQRKLAATKQNRS